MSRLSLAEVRWSAKDALLAFALGWIGIPLLLVLVLQYWGQFWPPLAVWIDQLARRELAANFILLAVEALATLGLVGYFLRRRGAGWRALGLRRFAPATALGWVIGLLLGFRLLVALIYVLVDRLWPLFDPLQEQVNEFTQAPPELRWLSFAALVILPPVVEEIVFRGFMFPAMAKRWGWLAGAIVSSLLFGVAHLQLNVQIYTLTLGLLLCMMYYRLGSIWPGIVFHLINNYLAFVALTAS